ncbi:PRK06851 family protein [Ammoniphilus sp. CFH 90114]|uniref:PRK06851 family protein n=1 Tax=Ammoniphilus sp. CFH 90114 TaxID=2493665 RepID=UPI00100EC589|nr:PRK06851 family protein [Ammoniphilus sp. CFH 90114]RXT08113.1 hypothetical protein EIZ39_11950 [Ammoniphilus sp. CFH 90114]
MALKILNYYAGGNTARGFKHFYDSNLQGLDRLFILKGGPGTGKSSLMKSIAEKYSQQGYNLELLHCSSDNDSIDGVLIPGLKVGIVDGTAPHVIEPKAPGAVEQYVNLGSAWDVEKLFVHKNQIQKISAQVSTTFENAYSLFAQALKIHDEWEKIFIENMNFSEANKLTLELIDCLYGDKEPQKDTQQIRHRYLGAATPKGAVDFIQNLTADIGKRYFIKGRPGSGKSTMLKKLAAVAEERGFDVEIYHCGFDPNSLDMVIVRELGFAIFDSTAPHEYFPERDNDEIIDMYKRTIKPGTDEKYADQVEEISGRYSSKMKEAIATLAKAKELHDELEKIYIEAMDFGKVNQIQAEIELEIDKFAQVAASK